MKSKRTNASFLNNVIVINQFAKTNLSNKVSQLLTKLNRRRGHFSPKSYPKMSPVNPWQHRAPYKLTHANTIHVIPNSEKLAVCLCFILFASHQYIWLNNAENCSKLYRIFKGPIDKEAWICTFILSCTGLRVRGSWYYILV